MYSYIKLRLVKPNLDSDHHIISCSRQTTVGNKKIKLKVNLFRKNEMLEDIQAWYSKNLKPHED